MRLASAVGAAGDAAEGVADMPGQGSGGNVLASLCSVVIPGLGQLVQGRPLVALVHFVLAAVLWVVMLGWIVHLWSIVDAARYRPPYMRGRGR